MKRRRWTLYEVLTAFSLLMFLATVAMSEISYHFDLKFAYAGVYRFRSFHGSITFDNQPLRSGEARRAHSLLEEHERLIDRLAEVAKARTPLLLLRDQRELTIEESAALAALDEKDHAIYQEIRDESRRASHPPMELSPLISHSLGYQYPLALEGMLPMFWLIAVYARAWNKHKAMRSGRCRACGYDLRASPTRCPECGTIVNERTTS